MPDRNRLDEEASPYLRQHADNPVHWQPWDDEALAEAHERDVPVFLSVGYSACHWCHVMEEESFEDETVAELLNDHFVPVKVDREERPDLDAVYQTVAQLTSGRGGWPLSVWLTPEGEPFHVGTYFPREPKRGMPGFAQLLRNIAESWADPEDRAEMEHRADQWTAAVAGEIEEPPEAGEPPDERFLATAADAAVRGADREHGGWGTGPKFPHPGRLHVLLRADHRTRAAGSPREAYREVAVETLDAMADGGMYDHLGGGFHRYATDREWAVPHFEKMLYDQAELVRAYLAGHQVTGDDRYARVAEETLSFVERELTHPDGGFFATLDARSADGSGEQVEGAYYVWTPEAVEAAVDDGGDAALFADRYGVTPAGNFEGDTVLTLSASVAELAAEHDLADEAVEERLDRAREQALAHREQRPRPRRDEKVIAAWNGLMAAAFAEAGLVLDEDHAATAADALGFVREHLWDGERLARRYKDGDVAGEGYLEDYAFCARGALACYEATGDVEHLAFALSLARTVREAFYDADAGTLYFTPEGGEELVARPQEVTDQSTPASAGVAAEVLLALDHVAPEAGLAEAAEAVVETHASRLEADPLQHASLVLAADTLATGHLELTVVTDGLPDAWRDRLGASYLPARLLSVRPPGEDALAGWLDRLGLAEPPPLWADRDRVDDAPTVYACRSFTCSPPQTDLDAALSWAADLAPDPG